MTKAPGPHATNDFAAAQILILSDGKPGHLNQSLAFAKLTGARYQVRKVRFRNRVCKALSYVFDMLKIRCGQLFVVDQTLPPCRLVVSAGSETYYANRVLAKRNRARSVALMLPGGYRFDFDLIVAQEHDRPPKRDNLLVLPVNLSCPVRECLVDRIAKNSPCIAVVIGGASRHFEMSVEKLKEQLTQIFALFPDGDFLVTTSRRTPGEVDQLLEEFPFRYRLLYSRDTRNPLADFLSVADYVFITEDSTSMISEAVCYGRSNVEILGLEKMSGRDKIETMVESLARQGCLHRFDGSLGAKNQKLDLRKKLAEVVPASWIA